MTRFLINRSGHSKLKQLEKEPAAALKIELRWFKKLRL
jgi:hypothetical protein